MPAETRLELEPGLTPEAFCDRVRDFVDWLIEFIEREILYERQGWVEHLEVYVWDGRRWRETLTLRERLQTRLSEGDLKAVAELLAWAHMEDLDPEAAKATMESQRALDEVDAGRWEQLASIPASRIASTSKVHSTAALDSWSIYDSRVANALAHAIDRWWREVGEPKEARLLNLRIPPSRESATARYLRQPPATFSALDEKAPTQTRLSFIYSSWLIRCIAQRLSQRLRAPDGADRWRPVHVEMALFSLGFDTRQFVNP
jgi:hypothetical protein